MRIDDRCQAEITELHRFFEAWFRGAVSREASNLERLAAVLAPDFRIISPRGDKTLRSELLEQIESAHGSHAGHADAFRIWIKNVETRQLGSGIYLTTYEEWQQSPAGIRGRLSTALLEEASAASAAPNGLVWRHVHETWLPAGERDGGDR